MKIVVTGGGKSEYKYVGTVYITQENTYNIVLTNVPITTNNLLVELFEGNTKIDSKEINL